MTLVVLLAAGLGLVLVLVGCLWARLRALSAASLAGPLAELAERVAALEAEPRKNGPEGSARVHPVPPTFRVTGPVYRVDEAEPSAVAGPTLIAVPSLASAPSPSAPETSHDLGRRFGTIWELADQGATPETIARRTGQPIGQVELILALRRQPAAQGGSRT
jgi:hypothetical protein